MWSRGQIIRLETVGKKSGRPHSVLVRYVTFNGKIIVFPDPSARQDWVANILANPSVRLYSDDGNFLGKASIRRISGLDDPILSIFQRKYGYQQVRQRYWGQTKYVEILIEAKTGTQDIEELIYGDLEVAFDSVAKDYDRHIFDNPMNRWLRDVSVSVMKRTFKPGDTVLEIGCGTGTETLSLAAAGVRIIASDISSAMLGVLEQKAKRAGLADLITTVQSRASNIVTKLKTLGYFELDGAYSTYGALNTEPRVTKLIADLHSMLKPGAPLVMGVWNKFCIYEILGYTLRMKPSLSLARFRNPVPVGRSRFCVSSYSYSVSEVRAMVYPYFRTARVIGVEILLPPSNLTKYLPPSFFLGHLKKFDYLLGEHFPWSHLGDHFLMVCYNVP